MKRQAVDLFSGTGSATRSFEESFSWEVFKVELEEEFQADLHKDILEVKPEDLPDPEFIWASPPCTKFSIAGCQNHWDKQEGYYIPKHTGSIQAVRLVYRTLWLIHELDPDYWVIENPRGLLRKILGTPTWTITYCQFGDNRMKPTDLWGELPETFEERYCGNGEPCHESAPRGSDTGTQGRRGIDRARVPRGLSDHIFEVIQNESV